MGSEEWRELRDRLLKENRLYEDPNFPAAASSLAKATKYTDGLLWRRPKELVDEPKFVEGGVSNFDLDQGNLGDCWFIAAAACLASTGHIFDQCVPTDQDFGKDYCGLFRFNFWHFDRWREILIDDRLPSVNGKLIYAHNNMQPNEFWAALLEKAYAKLHGTYETIDGGVISDALVDFTGGVSEVVDLRQRSQVPPNLFEVLMKTMLMHSMMGCSINTTRIPEEPLPNGLYSGHAYALTKVAKVNHRGKEVRLLCLQNPWGCGEWNGAWSDSSPEWKSLSADDSKRLQPNEREDGQFWTSYEDWIQNFEMLQFCHMSPESLVEDSSSSEPSKTRKWTMVMYNAAWESGINAGGCGNSPFQVLFWTNPQFSVTLTDPDEHSKDGLCTMIISLMQEFENLSQDLFISFYVYQLRPGKPLLLDGQNYDKSALLQAQVPTPYSNRREVTRRCRVKPGTYIIIPTTFEPRKEGKFVLRIYTEQKVADSTVVEGETELAKPSSEEANLLKIFNSAAGGSGQLDANELNVAIRELFKDTFSTSFGLDSARSLMCMMDRDSSGFIDYEEFRKLANDVNSWRKTFYENDRDRSGTIDTMELSIVFQSMGFKLSRPVLASLIRRYSGKSRTLTLEDFILCCARVVTMFALFNQFKKDDKAELTIEEWMSALIYN